MNSKLSAKCSSLLLTFIHWTFWHLSEMFSINVHPREIEMIHSPSASIYRLWMHPKLHLTLINYECRISWHLAPLMGKHFKDPIKSGEALVCLLRSNLFQTNITACWTSIWSNADKLNGAHLMAIRRVGLSFNLHELADTAQNIDNQSSAIFIRMSDNSAQWQFVWIYI